MKQHPTAPLLAALAVVLVWGLNFPLAKALFTQVGPAAFLGLRYLLMPLCAVALLYWRFRWNWPRLDRAEVWPLVRLTLVGQGLHLMASTYGMQGSTAFSASVLLACGPVFTLLILRFSGVETLSKGQIAGVATAAMGALLFTSDKLLAADWQAGLGDLTLLMAAALFSYYTVAAKPLIQHHGGVTVLGYGSLVCTLPMLLWCAPELAALDWAAQPAWVWSGTVWQVAGGGFLGWLAWGWANEKRGVARTAPFIYLMPPIAGITAWAWGGEAFSLHKILAAALILAGVALAQFGAAAGWSARRPPEGGTPG
ncbi:DMT family transporter [Roseateles asaccharophilus]|uniref:Drug/metabolite transporter (DMT)-like permease n=1 Tax=Roseateles asaccharophilus TaxID=582607 RepID=A0ABU2A5Z8_9BURK|nr:DMT family transporter [Roseateles asaccharophilus]MDR7332625.1 drug/metabolite transporter (DMT)-like permease [Roseateles asaccharophilus]